MYNASIQENDSSLEDKTRLITAEVCESVLVCTGVYDPNVHIIDKEQTWKIPTTIQYDALDAVTYALNKEQFL